MKKNKNKTLNKVFNNDAREILKFLGSDIKIKTTITSPPYFDMKDYGSENQVGYGQTYELYLQDLKSIFESIYSITDNDGSLWVIIDTFKRDNQVVTLPFDLSNKLKESGWLLQDIIIWKKDKTVPWSTKGFMQRKFEYILFFTKSNEFKYNKDRVRNFDTSQLKRWWVKYPERYNPKGKALDEIWEFPIPVQGSWGDQYVRHFCPLPKEMVATMIEISTDKEDLVLDPFAGSGSVLFQSSIMQRNYVGFELNIEYINMFEDYIKKMHSKLKKEHSKIIDNSDQTLFEKRILELRALKFGRILVNKIEENFEIEAKVYVTIRKFLTEKTKLLEVDYELLMSENIELNTFLNDILIKPPFSKFGITAKIKFKNNQELKRGKYYGYTKTNSYAYSSLPIESSKIKVISKICVNLKESDYE
ncbi:site-specific DNA-methyltransferase [Flavobacterium supellecticarium]|uniref:Methyltransferase n=1 Tax=Flavobacterium supellecticarium TaxID=2565924 RepID=A0A4S4A355_9FLAO|nr:site-specific DNA-methyltransferase [Flavobacterium supellecticarium]THF52842.1 site-specific DNA-methyltransferase [Flavobacterium supellecticarium]